MSTLVSIFKDYFSSSTFHGLRFIAEEGRHWTERLFWLICCLMSWVGSAILISSSWDSFQNNAISFVVETTYLDVDTKFPSISVCEEDQMARIYAYAISKYGPDHDCNLDEVLKEITFFRGTSYYIKEFCSSGEISCPKGNYKNITDFIRSPCKDIFEKCKWRGVEFDCCQHFRPVKTELGVCYTLSSKTEVRGTLGALKLDSNTKLGLGYLYIEVQVMTKVYMHAQSDLPFQNTITTVILQPIPSVHKHVGISITDIENEPEVRQLSVHQRKCRFPEENPLTVSNEYSNSACVTECRKNEQLKLCNCTSHLMPNTDESMHCDIDGILCLNNHYYDLAVQKTKWGNKAGLNCDCLPGCEESEYNSVVETLIQVESNNSILEIALDRIPTERYKRNVVRGRMDIVVSMGGAAGLFVGASLLSFAEFIYFFTLRLYNNITRKKENQEVMSASHEFLVAPLDPVILTTPIKTNVKPVYQFYM